MAITPFKTFAAAEILTAADLNSSFSKITSNGEDVAWPATKAKDLDGQILILDSDADTSITADTDDRIDFACASFDVVRMNTVGSAVNGLDLTSSATGNGVVVAAYGSDTDVDILLVPKGAGGVDLDGAKLILDVDGDTSITADTDDQIDFELLGVDVLRMKTVASAVNGLDTLASATGNAVELQAFGTDSNVDINIQPKGTGAFQVKGADTFRGHIDGLITSNGTDAAHDIDIAVGTCIDVTNKYLLQLSSGITKKIDVDWVEGTDAGGFPSALTLAADTWYHKFLLGKTDGSVDAGFDNNISATNLLADATGYTLFRRIASLLTDGSSNIIAYIQKQDKFTWSVPMIDVEAANPGTSAVTSTVFAPLGIETELIAAIRLDDTTPAGTTNLLVTSLDQADTAPSGGGAFTLAVGVASEMAVAWPRVTTNASSQIRYRLNVSTADHTVRISSHGWVDLRGKN